MDIRYISFKDLKDACIGNLFLCPTLVRDWYTKKFFDEDIDFSDYIVMGFDIDKEDKGKICLYIRKPEEDD